MAKFPRKLEDTEEGNRKAYRPIIAAIERRVTEKMPWYRPSTATSTRAFFLITQSEWVAIPYSIMVYLLHIYSVLFQYISIFSV